MLIRKKMPLIVLLLVALPVFLLSIVYYSYISDELIESNKERMKQVLNMEAASLESFLLERKQEVSYLSKNELVQELFLRYENLPNNDSFEFRMDNSELNAFFNEVNDNQQYVRDVFILSPYGMVLASTAPTSVWMDLSDRDYFKSAMFGETVISNLLKDRVRGESVLFVATPVKKTNTGEVIGVMAEIIDMKNKSDEIRQLIDPEVGDAYLLNRDGEIVFHTDKSLIGTMPSDLDIQAYFKSDKGTKTEDSVLITKNNSKLFFTYKSIANTDWKLVLQQDMSVINSSAVNALYYMIILSLILLTVAITIAVSFTKSITQPITELAKVMRETTKGGSKLRSNYTSSNELGQLATDFNYMLDKLDESQDELIQIQEKYALALKNSRDMIWEWDCTNDLFFVSENWEQLTGRKFYKNKVDKIVFEELLSELDKKRIKDLIDQLLNGKSELLTMDFEYVMGSGLKKWFSIKANAVKKNDEIIKISGTLVDNTVKKQAEEKIWNLAYKNQLTNIPNRAALIDYLDINQIKGKKQFYEFTLIILDIHNLKQINDIYGHYVGDQLLIQLASRLQESYGDCYHLSGDEFCILLKKIGNQEIIIKKLNHVFTIIKEPFYIEGTKLEIACNIGISRYPENGLTAEVLIQNADTALYQAKMLGKTKYSFFDTNMTERIMKKAEIEAVIRRAINDNLLAVHFQPLYNTKNQEIYGFEALMRLQLENGHFIPPSDFIPVAEETGYIMELGEWVIEYVFSKMVEWKRIGYNPQKVSINVSGVQLNNKNFFEVVKQLLRIYKVDPKEICLEITESVMMEALNNKITDIDLLRGIGFKIAIDDFGTGYSSFGYLRKLPLDYLKIDKSFVDHIAYKKKDENLLKQIIEIAHQIMELIVIAEGVETQEQYDILNTLNCDYIQGYYFSKPLNITKMEELLVLECQENEVNKKES